MKNKYLAGILFIIIFTTISLWGYQTEVPANSEVLSVSFLDVGQGDAIYIRMPNGNDLLIDGGPTDAVLRKLQETMPAFDHDIDLVIATHPDKDHVAGLAYVFDEYDVNQFIESEISSGTTFDKTLDEKVAYEEGVEKIIARRGMRIVLDESRGVFLDILFPHEDTSNYKETNTASIISRLTYGDVQFLFTGDAYVSNEKMLVAEDGALLQSEVLQLGHHGSKTSTSQEWIDAVLPTYVVVSVGKNNSYGHPNPETMKRATSRGAIPLVTAELGTIEFESDGKTVWRK